MSLPFLSCHPLKFAHIGSVNGTTTNTQVVDLGAFIGTHLVVFEEELKILNVLELHEAEIDRFAVQLVRSQSKLRF